MRRKKLKFVEISEFSNPPPDLRPIEKYIWVLERDKNKIFTADKARL